MTQHPVMYPGSTPGQIQIPGQHREIIIMRRNLQVRYAMILLGLLVAACFMVWWEMSRSLLGLIENGYITDLDTQIMVRKIYFTVAFKSALFLGVAWILAIALAHTIIRPIYLFERSLDLLKHGHLEHRIRLNKNDEFQFLAYSLNGMAASLQKKVKQDVEKTQSIAAQLIPLVHKLDSESNYAANKLIQELKKIGSGFRL